MVREHPRNPFRIYGTVEGEYFTDRTTEIERFVRVLREPTVKLLVYGLRRMGKTSTLVFAADRVNADGGHALLADLSTASTVTDIANRVLEAAGQTLGHTWRDVALDLARRLKASVSLDIDDTTGMALPSFSVSLREQAESAQWDSLGRVLDAVDALAASKDTTIGIILDEFQEIQRFGGTDAEWRMRGVIQRHQHTSYIFAGSKPHLMRRMLDTGRAFYGMLDEYAFGPIDPTHLGDWIDHRLEHASVIPDGAGAACIEVAGPRTRDVVQLARKTFDIVGPEHTADRAAVIVAFREAIEDADDGFRATWAGLTPLKQNVLRAVAAAPTGLTTEATRREFSLGLSGTVSNATKDLVDEGRLVAAPDGPRYAFDNPFFCGWVIAHTLPDIGIALDITHRAGTSPDR